MVRNTGFHRWRATDRLTDTCKIVVNEMKGHGSPMIVDLLAVACRPSSARFIYSFMPKWLDYSTVSIGPQ